MTLYSRQVINRARFDIAPFARPVACEVLKSARVHTHVRKYLLTELYFIALDVNNFASEHITTST